MDGISDDPVDGIDVIVVDGRIVSTGYNGTPEKMPNCLDGGEQAVSKVFGDLGVDFAEADAGQQRLY